MEIMPFAATWMDLDMITPSEKSQPKKGKYYMMSLICGVQNMIQMNSSIK